MLAHYYLDVLCLCAANGGEHAVELPLVDDRPEIVLVVRAHPELPRRRNHLVLSVSAGKDLSSILDALLPHADVVTATRANALRSLPASDVAAAVRSAAPELSIRVVPNPQQALRAAREGLRPTDGLCATGSIYLAGIARRVLAEDARPTQVAVTGGAPRVVRGRT